MSKRWKIAAIDLGKPLRELDCESGYRGVYAVFFRNGVAVGHRRIASGELPLSPAHLAAVASKSIAAASGDYLLPEGFRSALPGLSPPIPGRPQSALLSLVAIERPVSVLRMPGQGADDFASKRVTVAVCTRERPRDLARCLESIAALADPPDEILVVDNAPRSSATREVVDKFSGVRYLCEPKKGLSSARNTAMAEATGHIVAFADDDVIVHPDWVCRIRQSFDDPSVMVVTGLVLPAELETDAQAIFEHDFQFFHQGYRRRLFDSSFFRATRAKGVPVWSIGAGANMAIRRTAFELGYRFDTRLGPGVFGGCGEDSEYWYRLLGGGWSCLYEPSVCVSHYHRREISALRRLVYNYMKGHVAALLLQFAKSGDFGNLRRLVLRLPAEYLILLLRLVATGFSLDNRILLRGALGCLSGLRFALLRKQPS